MKNGIFYVSLLIVLLIVNQSKAQFNVSAEMRSRAELRDGYTTLPDETTDLGFFVGQRSRLITNFKNEKYEARFSVQDVRVWGQYPISNKGSMANVYEAWFKYNVSEKFSLTVGRQTLKYDDQRIVAARNWSNTGSAHDVLKFQYKNSEKNLEAHAVFGTSNEGEYNFQSPYTVKNYKYLGIVWLSKKINDNLKASFILLSDANENQSDSSIVYLRNTFGPNINYSSGKAQINGTYYYQGGQLKSGQDVKANLMAVNASYLVTDKFKVTLGYDHYSGTNLSDSVKASVESNAFSRVLGAGHKFLGYIDFFKDADIHTKGAGINDLYASVLVNVTKKTNFLSTMHFFSLNKEYISSTEKVDKNLGSELDLKMVYKAGKEFNITAGYSCMFKSKSMEALKGYAEGTTDFPNYVYLILSFKPIFFNQQK